MQIVKVLFTASAVLLSTAAGFAQTYGTWNGGSSGGAGNGQGGQNGSTIINGQINLQTNWSNLTGSIDTVGGDAIATGAAAGNLVDITTMNNTRVNNSQIVGSGAAIGSNVNVDVNNVWGNAAIGNQVVCNGAGVSTDPSFAKIRNYQECNATDPYSGLTTNISNVAGNAVVQGSSLGNTFEADSNASKMPILSRQINNSGTVSDVTANIHNIGGTATLSSSAIGNTSQIIHYSTN